MDSLVQEVLIKVVIDVLVSKSASWSTSTAVLPVVVVVSDLQMSKILAAVAIGVSDKRGLPVVVEVVPRNGNIVRGMGDVNLSVIVIWSLGDGDGVEQLVMVNPDSGGCINDHQVAASDKADLEIADNDIVGVSDGDCLAGETTVVANADDRGVAEDLDRGSQGNDTADVNHLGSGSLGSGCESCVGRDGCGWATSTSGDGTDWIVTGKTF